MWPAIILLGWGTQRRMQHCASDQQSHIVSGVYRDVGQAELPAGNDYKSDWAPLFIKTSTAITLWLEYIESSRFPIYNEVLKIAQIPQFYEESPVCVTQPGQIQYWVQQSYWEVCILTFVDWWRSVKGKNGFPTFIIRSLYTEEPSPNHTLYNQPTPASHQSFWPCRGLSHLKWY